MTDIPTITGGAFRLTRDWLQRLVLAVRSRTVVAGLGLRAIRTPGGTILSLAPENAGPSTTMFAKTDAQRADAAGKDDDSIPKFRSVEWREKKPALQIYRFDETNPRGSVLDLALELDGNKLRLRSGIQDPDKDSEKDSDGNYPPISDNLSLPVRKVTDDEREIQWMSPKVSDKFVVLPIWKCPYYEQDQKEKEGEEGEEGEERGPDSCGNPLNGNPSDDPDDHPFYH